MSYAEDLLARIIITAEAGQAVSTLRSLGAQTAATAAEMERLGNRMGTSARGFDEFQRRGGNMVNHLANMAIAVGGVGTAIAGFSIKAAAEYQTMIQGIVGNTALGRQGVALMNQEIRKFAETGSSIDDVAKAFMRVHNVFDNMDAKGIDQILTAANKAAVASGGKVEDTANVLAQTMSAFKVGPNDAAKLMNQIHIAAADGNMTLPEFVRNMSRAGAMSAALKMPFSDMAAMFDVLTKKMFSPGQSNTLIFGTLQHMIHEAKAAKQELAQIDKQTGLNLLGELNSDYIQKHGVLKPLEDLKKAFTDPKTGQLDMTKLFDIFPATRGALGLQALLSNLKQFEVERKKILGNKGLLDDQYNQMEATLGQKVKALKNEARFLAIDTGTILIPVALKLAKDIGPFMHDISTWVQGHKEMVTKAAEISVGLLGGGLALKLGRYLTGAALPFIDFAKYALGLDKVTTAGNAAATAAERAGAGAASSAAGFNAGADAANRYAAATERANLVNKEPVTPRSSLRLLPDMPNVLQTQQQRDQTYASRGQFFADAGMTQAWMGFPRLGGLPYGRQMTQQELLNSGRLGVPYYNFSGIGPTLDNSIVESGPFKGMTRSEALRLQQAASDMALPPIDFPTNRSFVPPPRYGYWYGSKIVGENPQGLGYMDKSGVRNGLDKAAYQDWMSNTIAPFLANKGLPVKTIENLPLSEEEQRALEQMKKGPGISRVVRNIPPVELPAEKLTLRQKIAATIEYSRGAVVEKAGSSRAAISDLISGAGSLAMLAGGGGAGGAKKALSLIKRVPVSIPIAIAAAFSLSNKDFRDQFMKSEPHMNDMKLAGGGFLNVMNEATNAIRDSFRGVLHLKPMTVKAEQQVNMDVQIKPKMGKPNIPFNIPFLNENIKNDPQVAKALSIWNGHRHGYNGNEPFMGGLNASGWAIEDGVTNLWNYLKMSGDPKVSNKAKAQMPSIGDALGGWAYQNLFSPTSGGDIFKGVNSFINNLKHQASHVGSIIDKGFVNFEKSVMKAGGSLFDTLMGTTGASAAELPKGKAKAPSAKSMGMDFSSIVKEAQQAASALTKVQAAMSKMGSGGSGLSKMSSELSKLASEGGKLTKLGSELQKLGSEANALNKVGTSVSKMSSDLSKLGAEGAKITKLGADLQKLGSEATALSKVGTEVTKMTSDMSKLAAEGTKITKLGTDLQKLGSEATSLSKVGTEITKLSSDLGKMDSQASKVTKLGADLQKLGSEASSLGKVATEVSKLSSDLSKLSSSSSHVSKLGADLQKLGSEASSLNKVGTEITKLSSDLQKLGTGSSQITKLGSSLQKLGSESSSLSKVGTELTKLGSDLQKMGSQESQVSKLGSAIQKLGGESGQLTKVATDLSKVGTDLQKMGSQAAQITKVGNDLQKLGSEASNLTKVGAAIQHLVSQAAHLSQVGSDLTQLDSKFKTFGSTVRQVMSETEAAISQMTSQAAAKFQQLEAVVIAAVNGMRAAWVAGMQGMVSSTASAVSATIAQLQRLASVAGQAFGWGANIGSAFAAGIMSQVGAVAAAASALVAAAQSHLEFHSPNKFGVDFAVYGHNAGTAWARGLASAEGEVRAAAERIVNAAVSGLSQTGMLAKLFGAGHKAGNISQALDLGDKDASIVIPNLLREIQTLPESTANPLRSQLGGYANTYFDLNKRRDDALAKENKRHSDAESKIKVNDQEWTRHFLANYGIHTTESQAKFASTKMYDWKKVQDQIDAVVKAGQTKDAYLRLTPQSGHMVYGPGYKTTSTSGTYTSKGYHTRGHWVHHNAHHGAYYVPGTYHPGRTTYFSRHSRSTYHRGPGHFVATGPTVAQKVAYNDSQTHQKVQAILNQHRDLLDYLQRTFGITREAARKLLTEAVRHHHFGTLQKEASEREKHQQKIEAINSAYVTGINKLNKDLSNLSTKINEASTPFARWEQIAQDATDASKQGVETAAYNSLFGQDLVKTSRVNLTAEQKAANEIARKLGEPLPYAETKTTTITAQQQRDIALQAAIRADTQKQAMSLSAGGNQLIVDAGTGSFSGIGNDLSGIITDIKDQIYKGLMGGQWLSSTFNQSLLGTLVKAGRAQDDQNMVAGGLDAVVHGMSGDTGSYGKDLTTINDAYLKRWQEEMVRTGQAQNKYTTDLVASSDAIKANTQEQSQEAVFLGSITHTFDQFEKGMDELVTQALAPMQALEAGIGTVGQSFAGLASKADSLALQMGSFADVQKQHQAVVNESDDAVKQSILRTGHIDPGAMQAYVSGKKITDGLDWNSVYADLSEAKATGDTQQYKAALGTEIGLLQKHMMTIDQNSEEYKREGSVLKDLMFEYNNFDNAMLLANGQLVTNTTATSTDTAAIQKDQQTRADAQKALDMWNGSQDTAINEAQKWVLVIPQTSDQITSLGQNAQTTSAKVIDLGTAATSVANELNILVGQISNDAIQLAQGIQTGLNLIKQTATGKPTDNVTLSSVYQPGGTLKNLLNKNIPASPTAPPDARNSIYDPTANLDTMYFRNGWNVGTSFAAGLTGAIKKIGSAAAQSLQSVKDYLEFHSPNKKGDDPGVWGANLGKAYAKGLASEQNAIDKAAREALKIQERQSLAAEKAAAKMARDRVKKGKNGQTIVEYIYEPDGSSNDVFPLMGEGPIDPRAITGAPYISIGANGDFWATHGGGGGFMPQGTGGFYPYGSENYNGFVVPYDQYGRPVIPESNRTIYDHGISTVMPMSETMSAIVDRTWAQIDKGHPILYNTVESMDPKWKPPIDPNAPIPVNETSLAGFWDNPALFPYSYQNPSDHNQQFMALNRAARAQYGMTENDPTLQALQALPHGAGTWHGIDEMRWKEREASNNAKLQADQLAALKKIATSSQTTATATQTTATATQKVAAEQMDSQQAQLMIEWMRRLVTLEANRLVGDPGQGGTAADFFNKIGFQGFGNLAR